MTNTERFIPFSMEAANGELILFRKSPDEPGVIRHDLAQAMISTLDTQSTKAICAKHKHFSATITEPQGCRKLYFMTYEQLEAATKYVSLVQAFESRAAAYEKIDKLPTRVVGQRYLVRHRKLGNTFCMKIFNKSGHPLNLALAKNEIHALQSLSLKKRVVPLVDLIEDEDTISVVTKHTKRSSLKDFVAKGPALTAEQVADFVAQIADGIR